MSTIRELMLAGLSHPETFVFYEALKWAERHRDDVDAAVTMTVLERLSTFPLKLREAVFVHACRLKSSEAAFDWCVRELQHVPKDTHYASDLCMLASRVDPQILQTRRTELVRGITNRADLERIDACFKYGTLPGPELLSAYRKEVKQASDGYPATFSTLDALADNLVVRGVGLENEIVEWLEWMKPDDEGTAWVVFLAGRLRLQAAGPRLLKLLRANDVTLDVLAELDQALAATGSAEVLQGLLPISQWQGDRLRAVSSAVSLFPAELAVSAMSAWLDELLRELPDQIQSTLLGVDDDDDCQEFDVEAAIDALTDALDLAHPDLLPRVHQMMLGSAIVLEPLQIQNVYHREVAMATVLGVRIDEHDDLFEKTRRSWTGKELDNRIKMDALDGFGPEDDQQEDFFDPFEDSNAEMKSLMENVDVGDDPDFEEDMTTPPVEEESVPREPPTPPVRNETPFVGRNDPCPCGSGKKFKKCCLK